MQTFKQYIRAVMESADKYEQGSSYFKQFDKGNRMGFTVTTSGKYDGYVKVGIKSIPIKGKSSLAEFEEAARVEFKRHSIVPAGWNADYKLEMK